MSVEELVPALQLSIGPVILISGIGLVMLSMTNRYGRVIDRARALRRMERSCETAQEERIREQLEILSRRARLGRLAILLASVSLLFAALLICSLFVLSYWSLDWGWAIVGLFSVSMLSFVMSLILFTRDVELSLKTFELYEGPHADL